MYEVGHARFRTKAAVDYYKSLSELTMTEFWEEWDRVIYRLTGAKVLKDKEAEEVSEDGSETGDIEDGGGVSGMVRCGVREGQGEDCP